MHSSRMRTVRSSIFLPRVWLGGVCREVSAWGVSTQGGICPGVSAQVVSAQGGCLPRGVSARHPREQNHRRL